MVTQLQLAYNFQHNTFTGKYLNSKLLFHNHVLLTSVADRTGNGLARYVPSGELNTCERTTGLANSTINVPNLNPLNL